MADLGIPGIGAATLIASGGSALVYRAITGTGASVAVKVLRGFRGAEVTRRFEREQQAASRLGDHPNIIDVIDSGVTGSGEPYLVMPLFSEGSLADELDRCGPFPLERALADLAHACDAIEFAHGRGVLHRDLKPANLLRSDDGSIVVADFGISRVVDAGITSATINATTPLFAAPELLSENDASIRTDVYSLGALLYALLNGAPAFAGAGNIWATLNRIRTEEPAEIPDVPDPIMGVIGQAMAKNPARRPASALALRELLSDAACAGSDWRPPAPHSGAAVTGPPAGPAMVPVVVVDRDTDEVSVDATITVPDVGEGGRPDRRGVLSTTGSKTLAVVAALALVGGLAAFAINQTLGSDRSASAAASNGPVDTSLPSPTDSSTSARVADEHEGAGEHEPTNAGAFPTVEAAPQEGGDLGLVLFEGAHFSALLPEGWSVSRSDVDVGYGYRSEFVAPDRYLTIDTTPSEQRTATTSIEASARDIAASIRSASEVQTEILGDLIAYSFTFRNNRGVDSIDIFFEVDGDGYAIVAGSNTATEAVFATARRVAQTIRSTS